MTATPPWLKNSTSSAAKTRTAVGNRRAWEERSVHELLRAKRHGGTISVILCDLDNFKTVNDTLGHAAGDRVLRATAALLTGRARATDLVVRLGGDGFCVLGPRHSAPRRPDTRP